MRHFEVLARRAFGNRRYNTRSLYAGLPLSMTTPHSMRGRIPSAGLETPKAVVYRFTGLFTSVVR